MIKVMEMRRKRIVIVAGLWAVVVTAVILLAHMLTVALMPVVYFAISDNAELQFPDYATMGLSGKQEELFRLAETTLGDEKPSSFYESVPMDEPWCANYVSYLYREIALPFKNPVSGGWRIPGIYTLRDYLVQNGFWRDREYTPVPGDIVIYDRGLFGGHTNIVLAVNGSEMMTIGGNENGKVRLMKFDYLDPIYGLVGYGHIIEE